MHIASVDGKELSHALRQLKSTPGTKRGTAFWVFGEELRIDWSGASKSIAARVAEPVPSGIVVDCNVMKQVTARLNYDGPTDIRFEDDALLIGRDRIGAHKATATRQVALPVDADDADVLLATLGFSPEGMADSGYGVEADEVVSKLKKSLSTAAKALLWTSLGPDRLGDMVMDELIAKARRIKERYEIPTEGPRWKFSSGEAHVDHIGREEEGLIYFYTWNNLDAVQIDNFKLRQMILPRKWRLAPLLTLWALLALQRLERDQHPPALCGDGQLQPAHLLREPTCVPLLVTLVERNQTAHA